MLKQDAGHPMEWSEERKGTEPAARGGAARTLVGSLMTRQVISVRGDTSVEMAAQLMLDNGVSRLPVVDAHGQLQGVLTKTDLIEDQVDAPPADFPEPSSWDRRPGGQVLDRAMHEIEPGKLVEEVMTKPALAVTESDTLAAAARIMVAHRVHGLPVVNRSERLVGVLSSLDILAWVAGVE
jgi:CBS domain-containing protein